VFSGVWNARGEAVVVFPAVGTVTPLPKVR